MRFLLLGWSNLVFVTKSVLSKYGLAFSCELGAAMKRKVHSYTLPVFNGDIISLHTPGEKYTEFLPGAGMSFFMRKFTKVNVLGYANPSQILNN